jgi:outer membrane lipoprotein SlyB
VLRLTTIAAFYAFAMPSIALADDSGAVTGAAGGAVTGAVVGGPVGAVIGGAAGAVIGGAASGPNRTVVVEPRPAVPCHTRTTETADNTGYSSTTQTTNCPD